MTIPRRAFLSTASSLAAFALRGTIRPLAKFGAVSARPRTDFAALRAAIKGTLILPDDSSFERARRTWSFNPRTDARPACIVRCADARDVSTSITFAREHSLELAVRGGGHDILGASTCDGGLVVDLSTMKQIDIDPARRTARVQPGVVSGELKAATLSFGLAPVTGCNPSVGISGLTLGGGIGWFLGTHGAVCDNLRAATIATADGRMLRANRDENPDLDWAIRGGGGNFGVVTEFEFQLQPITTVVGGVVAFRQRDIRPFLRFFRDYMKSAPDPLTVELSIFPDPDPVIWAMVCWNGSAEPGERALQPLRGFAQPIADTIERVPWARFLARMPQRTVAQTTNTYWRGGSLRVLTDAAIASLGDSIDSAPPGWQLGLGHFMHGRICEVPANATPFRRIPGQSTHFISASWRDPEDAVGAMQWVDRTWQALHRLADVGTYVNYLSESSEAAVKSSYGEHYTRLARLKHQYDPDNVFHRNRNILPSHGGA